MKPVFDDLMRIYHSRKADGRIKDPKSIAIIERYITKLLSSELNARRINSLMVLKCLVMSGDDMPHETNSAAEFQKAYRSWGVIYSRSMGSYDSVMWNLMHLDDLIWEVLKEEGIE